MVGEAQGREEMVLAYTVILMGPKEWEMVLDTGFKHTSECTT